jgi:ubiquinone/menaquinone biosynthesis C-methylase UbiE
MMGIVRRLGSIAKAKIKNSSAVNNEHNKIVPIESSEYWNQHNVTNSHEFNSKQESLDYFEWRNSQYLFYDELMPCHGCNDKVVMDFGCGPGNDLVGFLELSKPSRLIAVDVAANSLELSKKRVNLHPNSDRVEYLHLKDFDQKINVESNSIDYIHTSGVLHHIEQIDDLFNEFARILKPGGTLKAMVYNYNSIFVHLKVAYIMRILEKKYDSLSLEESFKRSTDGQNCPISRYYTPEQFITLGENAKFDATYLGAAVSLDEMNCLQHLYNAILSKELPKEHRAFLRKLSYDNFKRPIHNGHVAGIDAVFKFTKPHR